jgi:hypothetical protein
MVAIPTVSVVGAPLWSGFQLLVYGAESSGFVLSKFVKKRRDPGFESAETAIFPSES